MFSEEEQAALNFGRKLCARVLTIDDYDRLKDCFTEHDVIEIVVFCAWQYGGPAVLSSWGAESYKQDGKVVLDALPVRLAYAEFVNSAEPLPVIPDPPVHSFSEIYERAEQRQSPPQEWLTLLSSHPNALNTWNAMYELFVENGVVENRIKQLQRVLIADRFDCPDWVPEKSLSIEKADISEYQRNAIKLSDFSLFSERECAALCYTENIILSGKVVDEQFQRLKAAFSWSEIIELGYAVATQAGAVLTAKAILY